MKKLTKKDFEKLLRNYEKEYDQVKAGIREISYICKGSITERRLPCGNPSCRCHKDHSKLHGPYYQLSWKEKGKTVSHYISSGNVHFYKKWIKNRRMLLDIINEMEVISRKAGDCIRNYEKQKSKALKKGKKPKKKTS